MKVWAYTIVRNEAKNIGRWLRHYGAFCERLTVYDDSSDDGTLDILAKHGADVYPLPYSGLDDARQAAFSSQMYREARGHADFVVVVDADEMLFGEINPSWTLPDVQGFQMFSETDGVPYAAESKPCLFRPELELQFSVGRHSCNIPPIDRKSGLKLLHYRHLNRADSLARSAQNYERLPYRSKLFNWGRHTWPQFRDQWADQLDELGKSAQKVI